MVKAGTCTIIISGALYFVTPEISITDTFESDSVISSKGMVHAVVRRNSVFHQPPSIEPIYHANKSDLIRTRVVRFEPNGSSDGEYRVFAHCVCVDSL